MIFLEIIENLLLINFNVINILYFIFIYFIFLTLIYSPLNSLLILIKSKNNWENTNFFSDNKIYFFYVK